MSQLPDSAPGGSSAAGRILDDLLRHDARYRAQWVRRSTGGRADELSIAAIARVLAEHLWESGERPDTHTTLARDLKDRVARALHGRVLTAETLRWFVEAFALDVRDAGRLWTAYAGTRPDEVAFTLARPRPLVVAQRHWTVAVFEHYRAARGSAEHTTVHAITAMSEWVASYTYVPYMPGGKIVVEHGGHVERRMPFGEGLEALEIVLTAPIGPGEVASLRYHSHFADAPNEFRRFAHGRTENVDIRVSFPADDRPNRVWWTVWDDYRGGHVLSEEPVSLDEEHAAHRFLARLQQAVVGFRWQWQ